MEPRDVSVWLRQLIPPLIGFHRGWVIARVLACVGLISTAVLADDEPLVRVRYRVLETAKTTDNTAPETLIREKTVEGRLLVKAVDGGVVVEDRQGVMWPITASQTPVVETTETPYAPLNAAELTTALQAEFGEGFEVISTPHYLICTNAGTGYGEWCGQLFERLHSAFQRFWIDRMPGLDTPDRPLVAIAFASRREFQNFQVTDAGGQVASAQGYFSAKTNRMVLFDLSSETEVGRDRDASEIQKLALRNPATIATVIHEAVHQLAFNVGLQTRYADNPLWFSEGLAMYFEAPDLETRSGWKTIGQTHPVRLDRYRLLAKQRPPEIRSLIATDDRFRDPQTALDVYAEAWALHFFLIRTQKDKYNSYLKTLRDKPRMKWDSPEQRVTDFEAAFGSLADVEREQLKFMTRLRGGR